MKEQFNEAIKNLENEFLEQYRILNDYFESLQALIELDKDENKEDGEDN